VRVVEPGRALVLGTPVGDDSYTWAFVVESLDADRTRLYVRTRSTWSYGALEAVDSLMGRETLRGIKARAEGRGRRPLVVDLVSRFGWAVAGAAVLGLFLARRRRWPWLVAPVLATLPALMTTRDVNGALAGFLAVGIVTLGALTFGLRWWALFPAVAVGVLTVLLVAPDVYAAFGLLFVTCVSTAVGVLIYRSRRPRAGVTGRRVSASASVGG
jgi:hypothetical protein